MRPLPLIVAAAAAAATAACAPRFRPSPLPALPFPVDSSRTQVVADGVVHRFLRVPTGPWPIHILDVDLDRCNQPVAVKGSDKPTGRTKTSVLLADLAKREPVVGGVNADFFSLATGAPIGLLVVDGKMLTPPVSQPVLAVDSSGVVHLTRFTLSPSGLKPFHPLEAVGGRPMIVRDSTVLPEVDTEGQKSFNVNRNPRTAAGLARNGRRLLLVTVDGREVMNGDGMSLRELANLMLALGARDAINLDGGGSTTLVYADPAAGGALRVANHPSDKEGERTVGDALAIVHRCAR